MAPLDALYPKMRVFSNDERQQTLHRMSTMPESTYQEAVKNETYRENRSNAKNVEGEIAPLDALYPTMRVLSDCEKQKTTHRLSAIHESTYKEDVKRIAPLDALYPTMRVLSDCEKQKTTHRMSAMHESTYKEDVKKIAPLDASYPMMRVNSDSKNQQTHNRMSAMNESTHRGDVKDKTYRENGNCAKNVLMSAPHYPRDRQSDTIGPALMARTCTKTRGQRRSR